MGELFGAGPNPPATPLAQPLAERMRPGRPEELEGQPELCAPGAFLDRVFRGAPLPSVLLWGPPGSGKTTVARMLASAVKGRFVAVSAVLVGVKELREIMEQASLERRRGTMTVLFVDEIHRYHKGQQDAFLPFVESGDVVLVGATTENPSFEVNKALLSRMTVLRTRALDQGDLLRVLQRACAEPAPRGLGRAFPEAVLGRIAGVISGDARRALNVLEQLAFIFPQGEPPEEAAQQELARLLAENPFIYDKSGDQHYDLISAFIKSLRGSDPDAAMYWMTRILKGGEDPLFVARRMLIFASEDVGNADPQALTMAVAVYDAVRFIGPPECHINLAQGVTYLATAPKSNASYTALRETEALAEGAPQVAVPMHLRNAPTKLMKDFGMGEGYLYPHDFPGAVVDQDFLPPELEHAEAYRPGTMGYEKKIREMMEWRRQRRAELTRGRHEKK